MKVSGLTQFSALFFSVHLTFNLVDIVGQQY